MLIHISQKSYWNKYFQTNKTLHLDWDKNTTLSFEELEKTPHDVDTNYKKKWNKIHIDGRVAIHHEVRYLQDSKRSNQDRMFNFARIFCHGSKDFDLLLSPSRQVKIAEISLTVRFPSFFFSSPTSRSQRQWRKNADLKRGSFRFAINFLLWWLLFRSTGYHRF